MGMISDKQFNLENAVGSRKTTQALDAPRKYQKWLITNMVTRIFDISCAHQYLTHLFRAQLRFLGLTFGGKFMWIQRQVVLRDRLRGFHIITNEVLSAVPEIGSINIGLLNVFIKHTSASLTINENADPTVRKDFEQVFNRLVPEDQHFYLHDDEGPDDLPAHIKASMLGASVTLPISDGGLNIGIWQGIYLCEHRNNGGERSILITVNGE